MLKKMVVALAAGVLALAAHAQAWPTRPITMVMPFPPGGAADMVARAIAQEMSAKLGQPVLVDNRAGASGVLGANLVVKAPPDGYTILFTTTLPVMTAQFLYARVPYDPRRDLAFISQVATGQLVLAVNPNMPVTSVAELTAWLKAHQGRGSYGSWSIGSYAHLAGSHFSEANHLELVHVPYKGESPMLQDLVSGQLTMAIGTLGSMRPFIDSGKLRALAVTGDKRLPDWPNLPTFAQAGLKDAEYKPNGWLVMMAPAATPPAILARIEKEVIAAANTASVKARLQIAGLEPIGSTSKQFRKEYEELMPVLQRVVKASGARLD